jgi:hypothetical protein
MLLICVIVCGIQVLILKRIRKNEPKKKSSFTLAILSALFIYSHMIAATIFSF